MSIIKPETVEERIKDRLATHSAILMDMDGTLFEQFQFVSGAFMLVADFLSEKLQIDKNRSFEELMEIARERTMLTGDHFNVFLNRHGIFDRNTLEEMIITYHSFHPTQLTPYDDVVPFLEKTKSDGYLLGLVSSGNEETQRSKLNALQLSRYFDCVSFCPGKKTPEIFLPVLEKLNTAPENAVCIGDNPVEDFFYAKKMGMTTIRLLRGQYRTLRPDTEHDAHFEFETFPQIYEFLASLNRPNGPGGI